MATATNPFTYLHSPHTEFLSLSLFFLFYFHIWVEQLRTEYAGKNCAVQPEVTVFQDVVRLRDRKSKDNVKNKLLHLKI